VDLAPQTDLGDNLVDGAFIIAFRVPRRYASAGWVAG
jgi:hypothetical protein